MKKRFAAVLAATAVLGVTTAFAANPFSDVEAGHWAYQSVSQLAAAGIINGYPDGTFKGQNNITRYEMAQMVAKAMANQGRADVEQNAMINRLADEFSEELNNLGVRVGNLEKRVGNVKVTGDFRLRYDGWEKGGHFKKTDPVTQQVTMMDKKSKFTYRARLQFNAMVNDRTSATVRLVHDNEFGNDNSSTTVDRAFVTHKFSENASLELGRLYFMTGQGLVYDDAFDGAKITLGSKNLTFTGIYGEPYVEALRSASDKWTVGQIDATFDKAALNVFAIDGHGQSKTEILGVSGMVNLDKIALEGEWSKDNNIDNSTAWTAGITYGNYSQAKKGTWNLKAQYFDLDTATSLPATTWKMGKGKDYTGWVLSSKYALQKNVGLTLLYGFSGESQDGKTDIDDFYRAELNYRF